MSGSSDSQGPSAAGHGWDASGTLWNPVTMSSHAAGSPADGPSAKVPRSRGRSSGRAACQVPGCTESLIDCKPYFKRHLVCQTHAVSPLVSIDGIEMRFCQQCAKFERVTAFDSGNRSCRFRLFRRNVAKHRTQLAKRAAQSSDEPEVRPARQSQAPKTIRTVAQKDAALGTTATTGDGDLDGAGGADADGQVAGSPSAPQQEASGRSSGEPDTRCWDAERNPSQYWGGMMGSEDWRSQATSGPSTHSTKRTRVALPGLGSTTGLDVNRGGVDDEEGPMGAVRMLQPKRRQRAAPTRTRDESNSESRTMLSQDVNDDVDATLAPFTSGLRLDMPSEDTTEPSAIRAGDAGRPSASEPQHVSSASPVRSDSMNMMQHQEMHAHQHHQQQKLTSERALLQIPGQLRQPGTARGEPGRDARPWWQEIKDTPQTGSGRLLQSLARDPELYDAISSMSTEPAERYDAGGGGGVVTAAEAAGQRLRAMASGMSNLGLRVRGLELTTAGSGGAGDMATAAHVPLALQSLSSRLDLNHGDRMALESLLGLSTGPVALRSMASSTGTSLDEQLYDILHDVMKEGGGDTGWFKGTGAAAGTVAAAAAAAPARAIEGSGGGVAGPMAAAYAYLGMPPPMRPEERLSALTLGRTDSGGGGGGHIEMPGRRDSMQRDLFDCSGLQGLRMPQGGMMAGQPGPTPMTASQLQQQSQQQQQQRQMHMHRQQQQQPQGLLQPSEQQLRLQQQQPPTTSAVLQLQELHQEEKNLEQKLQQLQQRKVQLLQHGYHHAHPQMQPQQMQPQQMQPQQMQPQQMQPQQMQPQQMQPQQMQPQQMQPQQMQPQQMQPQQMQPQQMQPQQMQPQQMQPQQMQPQQMQPRMTTTAAMEATPTNMLQHAHSAATAAAPDTMPWSGARGGMAVPSPHGYGMGPQSATASAAAAAAGSGVFAGPHPQQQHPQQQHPQQHPQSMMGHRDCDTHPHGGTFGVPGHGMAASHPQTQVPALSGRPCTLPPALLRPQQLPPAVPPPPAPVMPKPVMASHAGHISWAGSGWGEPATLRGVGSGGSSGDCEADAPAMGLAGWGLASRDATESPWDDYQGHYDTIRLSLKMMDCTPYDMDPSTQDLLHQFACEGGRCAAPPPLASVRPGCLRIVVDATVRVDRDRVQPADVHQASFSVRAGEALAAVRRLAVLNETAVLVQAGSQVVVVDKAGGEVAAESLSVPAALPAATPPVLSRASMAAVYVGARGCFQVFGTGLSGPNVEFWGRMHGVHHQLQVQHTANDTYALVQLPVLTCCGLLVVEAASGSDASLLSEWLAIVVVPSERVANEVNGLQSRLPQTSLRRLLVDLGSLLDILPILSQPVNGVCPVVGQLAGASSGCSKNTWRSSSVEPDLGVPEGVCGVGLCGGGTIDSLDADASSEAPATEAGVLSCNMSYSGTDSTLASSHDGPHKSSLPSNPSVFGGAGGSSCCISGFGGASSAGCSAAGPAAGASGASAPFPPVGTALKLSTQVLASIAERNGGGAGGSANVRRLLRCFDPSELLTNGDDETVVQQLLAPEAVRQLLARAVSVTTFFAQRMLVDSALCAVSAVSELYCAFPDLMEGHLAPRPQRGAPCLMHAAVRSRSLALLLALTKCSPVLGDHVNLAWPGPGGITPLHLVALLAQPYVITGLQFVVPEVRELWYSLRDDNGVTPANLLAQALQRQAPAVAAAPVQSAQPQPPVRAAAPPLPGPGPAPPGGPTCAGADAGVQIPLPTSLSRGVDPVTPTGSRVDAVSAAGKEVQSAEEGSELDTENFVTPLPSPPQSAASEHDAELAECAGGAAAAVAESEPPSALWPGWGELAAVVNQRLPQEQDAPLPHPPQDEDLETDVALVAAGMAELSFARLRHSGRASTHSWMGSVGMDERGNEGNGMPVDFTELSARTTSEDSRQPLMQQQQLLAEVQQQQQQQGGSAVSALTGIARNVARRLMPW